MNQKRNAIRTPECHCLACSHKIDASSMYKKGTTPSTGRLSVCVYCGAVSMFAEDLTLRAMTDEEIADVSADSKIMNMLRRIVQAVHFVRTMKN